MSWLKDKLRGIPGRRSPQWPKVEKEFLSKNPVCSLCGGKNKLTVHHIRPFHLFQKLELDENNLISLCEAKNKGINCHLFVGHLSSWKSFNITVKEDAKMWFYKIKNRP